jgi:lipopolysaccharide/colanic/teichoic acid biosynthesis glycosyltransferase
LTDGTFTTDGFALVSLAATLIAFRAFRISSVIPRYLSVGDLLNLAKAVVAGDLITTIFLFTFTRLDGIPRSVPAIHALVLGAGLLTARGLAKIADLRRSREEPPHLAAVNIIVIGLNNWSVLLLKFLQAHASQRWRVIALLDEAPEWFGRSVNGVQVFGPPAHLQAVIEELALHGVDTHRVIVGEEAGLLSEEALREIRAVCARRNVDLVFVPDLLALDSAECVGSCPQPALENLPACRSFPDFRVSPYLRFKRPIDFCAAGILILWLLPLLAIAALIVILDVGSPVLFWQQRVGRYGRELRVYKLRTLRSPFNRRGQKMPEEQRLSWIGGLLRRTRIDELPQLLNVLVGDMSLIGPRPLLSRDQPSNPVVRLLARPGITGWAQVNGGAALSSTEKDMLDIWYVANASPWLDLRIAWMTFFSLVKGDRRSEGALALARAPRRERVSDAVAAQSN